MWFRDQMKNKNIACEYLKSYVAIIIIERVDSRSCLGKYTPSNIPGNTLQLSTNGMCASSECSTLLFNNPLPILL